MDKMSKIELTSTITKQNEQIKRYEGRLRDVVTAYKGLVREKEALEASLAAINNKTEGEPTGQDGSVATLTLSVSTLVTEKARMEEAFQNDKKVAREQNEKIVSDLQEQLNSISKQKQLEIDNFRAKLAYEIQEREREQIEHSLMLKELQMKLTSERRSKEKLEDRISITSEISGNLDLEKKLRDLNNELEATQRKLNRAEARTLETPQMLIQLQEEIAQMKQNHIMAIREERIKAKRVEEGAKRMCASQEERIATLEARLAELSETVGEYDMQRRRDQDVIQQLKNSSCFQDGNTETARSLDREKRKSLVNNAYQDENSNAERPTGMAYLQELIDKIHNLRKELIIGNEAMGNPIDIWNIFNISGSGVQNIHSACKAELAALKTEYELFKRQHSQSADSSVQQKKMNKNQVDKLKSHIKSLQEKAEILNQQLEDTEKECDTRVGELEEKIKNYNIAHKEEVSEYKSRVISLEQQLQAQRERYSVLLGEREVEIKARQEKEGEGKKDEVTRFINGALQEGPTTPMLHYAHEVARKDLEISQLRKDKHLLEGQLRDSQRDATIDKDRFKEVRRNLKEEIDRLLRIQSREGANLEYLKNVVLSYLLSADLYRKRHMLKAICAVLHFTDTEKESAFKTVS